jgi:hypothetical protein
MARDDLLISTNEREFIVKALQEAELRVDGRGPFDARAVSYRFGPKDGVCEVRLSSSGVPPVAAAAPTAAAAVPTTAATAAAALIDAFPRHTAAATAPTDK